MALMSGCGEEKKDELEAFLDDVKENDPEYYKQIQRQKSGEVEQQQDDKSAPSRDDSMMMEEGQDTREVVPAQLSVGRGWPEKVCYYHNVGVEHEGRYLEGPFEKQGSEDGRFNTWDWDSAISLGASPAFFVGNVVLMPASMVIAPPWQRQVSRSIYAVVEPMYELPGEPSGMARKE